MRSRRAVVLVAVIAAICSCCATAAESATGRSAVRHRRVSDKYGFIDRHGHWVIRPQFDAANSFARDGLAVVWKGARCYYINKTGRPAIKLALPRRIWRLEEFSEGLARVLLDNGKSGYIDRTGKLVIKPVFDSAGSFKNGLAVVSKKGLTGFIDKSGTISVPLKYKEADDFSEGLASVGSEKTNRMWRGYVRTNGTVAIDLRYFATSSFSEGLAAVSLMWAAEDLVYIDKTGKQVIAAQFEYAEPFHSGLAWVGTLKPLSSGLVIGNHNWGLIDRRGRFVLVPRFYEHGEWSEGMASVSQATWTADGETRNIKVGFVSKHGRVVVVPRFIAAGPYSEGLAPVALRIGKAMRCGFIDMSGKLVIQPRFTCAEPDAADDPTQPLYVEGFSEGRSAVMLGGKIGYIDRSGRTVVKPLFGEARRFSQGLACVSYTDHSKDAAEPPHPGG